MSNDAGDSPSRLSHAPDDGATSRSDAARHGGSSDVEHPAGAGGDEHDQPSADGPSRPQVPGEPYVLPEIVPATADSRPAAPDIVPKLPDRPTALATGRSPATPPTPPAPMPQPVPPAPGTAQVPTQQAPATRPAIGWGDDVPPPAAAGAAGQLRTPGRRPRVRRVTRVLRHVDPWSTFKVALLFNAVAYIVCLTSGVLLWRVADSTGTLDNVERWFTQFGWETFELDGGEIFHNAWIIGLFAAVAATGGAVLLATLFNLVSDIVGGVRMTVLEEEVVERTISSTRRYVVRRPADVDTAAVATAAWSADDLDDDGVPDTDAAEPAPERTSDPGRSAPSTAAPRQAVSTPASEPADWSVD